MTVLEIIKGILLTVDELKTDIEVEITVAEDSLVTIKVKTIVRASGRD